MTKGRPRLWGAIHTRICEGKIRLAINYKRLAALSIVALIISWMGLSGAIYLHYRYKRQFDEASYLKMLVLPFRWDEHRQELGDFYVKKGFLGFNEKRQAEGFSFLRAGLNVTPKNTEARLFVANIHINWLDKPEVGLKLLREGLPHNQENIHYLKHYFKTLGQLHLEGRIVEEADKLLQVAQKGTQPYYLAKFVKGQAYLTTGNTIQAEKIAMEDDLADFNESKLMQAWIKWVQGSEDEATSMLEELFSNDAAKSDPVILNFLSKFYIMTENYPKAIELAAHRTQFKELALGALMDLVQICQATGDDEPKAVISNDLLMNHSDKPYVFQHLAKLAGQTGDINLARKIHDRAFLRTHEIGHYVTEILECHTRNKEFQAAKDLCDEIRLEAPRWYPTYEAKILAYEALSYLQTEEKERGSEILAKSLKCEYKRGSHGIETGGLYEEMDQVREAQEIYLNAYKREPINRNLLEKAIETELQVDDNNLIIGHLREYLANAVLKADLANSAYDHITQDRYLFEEGRDDVLGLILKRIN